MDLTISIEAPEKCGALYGPTDANLRAIRAAFDVRVTARDGSIHLSGDTEAVRKAADAIGHLQKKLHASGELTDDDLTAAISRSRDGTKNTADARIEVFANNAKIGPKTEGQARYIDAIVNNDATFCLGPAGSGKTYIAVALALTMLKRKQIEKIILARPAVEAGEKLGYLPGDLQAKVNPYLRPLFDALHDMIGFDQGKRFMDNDIIEVIPLAFMRGRTLNRSMIILDEAQNTTTAQMFMVLTRMGVGSKMIVTADDSQIDLPPGQPSGVLDAVSRLGHVKGIAVIRLEKSDIVRHSLVQQIVDAYARE